MSDLLSGMAASALAIADRAVVDHIKCEGTRADDGADFPVYDVGVLFDDREHSAESIDKASEAITYAVARGLVELLPHPPLKVRLLRRP